MSDDDQGFLMLWRRMFDHALWQEPRVYSRFEAWLDFIATASFRPRKTLVRGELVPLQRGQLVASLRFLERRWNWSDTKVESFLKLLEAEGMIEREKRQGITVITLCKFDTYNRLPKSKKAAKRRPTGTKAAEERQESGEIEEGKEGKKVSTATPPVAADAPAGGDEPANTGTPPEVVPGTKSRAASIEDVRTAALRFQPTSTCREKPDPGFVDWWWDEQEKRGWVDAQSGLPWRDWEAAFRAAWRGHSHRNTERKSKTYGPKNQRETYELSSQPKNGF